MKKLLLKRYRPSHELCQYMVENMETALLLFDGELRLLAINPAGENLLQASARTLIEQHAERVFSRNPQFSDLLHRVAEQQRAMNRREARLSVSSDNVISVDCSVTPVSRVRRGVDLLMEITRVDRLMRLAREGALQEQYRATRKILRGIAHEVKNPLGGLRGAAQLLDMEIEDESLREYTGIIIREADRLSAMVDKMSGPNKPLQLRQVNVHEILEHVRALIQAEYPAMIETVSNYDPSLPEINADPDALTQVILNICRNAVQAMLEDPSASSGQPNRLRFSTHPTNHFTIGKTMHRLVLQLDIEDNGPGIPKELQDTIFYPLITSKAEGAGLGLSIVQNIINQHHGLIEFNSQPGKTVFSIFLPLDD
jgi:two-component system nitrogen regulation sensor histidine kinase GlnL